METTHYTPIEPPYQDRPHPNPVLLAFKKEGFKEVSGTPYPDVLLKHVKGGVFSRWKTLT